jgi:hypothetical protein
MPDPYFRSEQKASGNRHRHISAQKKPPPSFENPVNPVHPVKK